MRDGLQYTPVEHKPIGHKVPWLSGPGKIHWCCRSTSAPVVKSFEDLGGELKLDLSPEQRASMDGQVPSDTTYGDWIKRQSAARQDQILGPTRGALLRRGGLTLEKFSNDKGSWLTLAQLKERNAEAFKRAGL